MYVSEVHGHYWKVSINSHLVRIQSEGDRQYYSCTYGHNLSHHLHSLIQVVGSLAQEKWMQVPLNGVGWMKVSEKVGVVCCVDCQ